MGAAEAAISWEPGAQLKPRNLKPRTSGPRKEPLLRVTIKLRR